MATKTPNNLSAKPIGETKELEGKAVAKGSVFANETIQITEKTKCDVAAYFQP